jgi:Uma2 family endonuclease
MSVLDFVSQLHRYSVAEYDELVARGAFDDQRVELIDGLVLDMSPKSDRHESAVRWLLNAWLMDSLDRGQHQIVVGAPIRLAKSEPEPDLAVVDLRPRKTHPTEALLVIEVAHSSLERDLTLKPRLYAPAVAEYWVLDLSRDHFVVHRDPGHDGYREITVQGRGADLRTQHVALEPLRVADLLEAI